MDSMGQHFDLETTITSTGNDSLSRSPSILRAGGNAPSNATSLLAMEDHKKSAEQPPEEEELDEEEDLEVALSTKQKSDELGQKLKEELCRYKQELKEYNETTKDLEEKYMKINYELNEMQQKHQHFVAHRGHNPELDMESEMDGDGDARYYKSSTSVVSDMSLKCKSSRIFRSNTSFMTVLSSDEVPQNQKTFKQSSSHRKIKSNLSDQVSQNYGDSLVHSLSQRQARRSKRLRNHDDLENRENPHLKDVYNVLKDVINTTQEHKSKYDRDTGELTQLYSTIKNLKSEHSQFRNTIRQQQERIADYHTRCVKAQEIMKTQKHEIDKLHVNNKQLESSIYHDIDNLRSKIDTKLKNFSHLPQMMREEHAKYEKVMRENCLLSDNLRVLQKEASQLKVKIDELGKRKLVTINRLKAAERDLKIFKNYNSALKNEKRRLSEELSSVKEQLEALQATNKRQLTRHRDQSEKQRRDLQKRIFDLELKLSRSQNSTSSLIQERDSLIAELQTQLHTLVHNFEVSQKHIRVLRRHIYSMTNPSAGANGLNNPPRSSETGSVRVHQVGNNSSNGLGPGPRLINPRTLKTKS